VAGPTATELIAATHASMIESYRRIAQYAPLHAVFEERGPLALFTSAAAPLETVVVFELAPIVPEVAVATLLEELAASLVIWFTQAIDGRSYQHELLIAHGCQHHTMPIMTLPLARLQREPRPHGLTINEVRNDDEYELLTRVQIASLGEGYAIRATMKRALGLGPGAEAHHLIGILADEPVAAATMLETGPLPTLWGIGTLDAWRGRGIGRAMTLAACELARLRAHSHISLWATPLGIPVYRGIGFTTQGLGATYTRPASTS